MSIEKINYCQLKITELKKQLLTTKLEEDKQFLRKQIHCLETLLKQLKQ